MRGRGIVVIAAVVAAWPAAAVAKRVRMVPKGTPYAAEVLAMLTGTTEITYSDDSTTFNVCEDQSSEQSKQVKLTINWSAKYPQVTVPTADDRELGKAWKKLRVRPTITAEGTGGVKSGTFSVGGFAPPTSAGNQARGGTDCQKRQFGTSGTVHSTARPSFEDYTVDYWIARTQVYGFTLPQPLASPATYRDPTGGTSEVINDLGEATGALPTFNTQVLIKPLPLWNADYAAFDINKLKRLSRKHDPGPIDFMEANTGAHDCSTPSNGTGTDHCQVNWKIHFKVVLRRRARYLSKNAYPY